MNEGELICINLTLTDAHMGLIKEIEDLKNQISQAWNGSLLNYQIIPQHAHNALSYVCRLGIGHPKELFVEDICHINSLFGCSGKFRPPAETFFDENNIAVNGYHPPSGASLSSLMDQYVKEHTSIDVQKSDCPLEGSCRAYFLFEQIHPFTNGNGRTGRAICSWLLLNEGYGHLVPYIELRWGKENKQHFAAFASGIRHYLAWLNHPDYLNEHYAKFLLRFLREIRDISRDVLRDLGLAETSD